MQERVAIVGIGSTAFRSISPDVSFREMTYEAAVKAYADAGVEPKDVDTFVCVSEDYMEGTAIFDEYVPDQIGAALRPVHTIAGDGLTGIAAAFLQLQTGEFDIAVVEGHSKASNVRHLSHIEAFALDPVMTRPLALNPRFVAGLEMRRYLQESGASEEDAAAVVVKNRENALKNPLAAYPGRFCAHHVMSSPAVAEPLKKMDVAAPADGAIVVVLARECVARRLVEQPVYIQGIGWAQDTPDLDMRDWSRATYAQLATAMACRMAKIKDPSREVDFAEIDDAFSYKELQHLEAVMLAAPGQAAAMLRDGYFDADGEIPVNVSGGSLGNGFLYDAAALRATAEAVTQLRGLAGGRQVKGAETCLVQSWRGIPTAAGAVAILSNY